MGDAVYGFAVAVMEINHATITAQINFLRCFRHDVVRVLDAASQFAGAPLEMVRGQSQTRELSRRRWHVEYLLFHVGWSKSEIGRRLIKDHTSVMYGIKEFERRFVKFSAPESEAAE